MTRHLISFWQEEAQAERGSKALMGSWRKCYQRKSVEAKCIHSLQPNSLFFLERILEPCIFMCTKVLFHPQSCPGLDKLHSYFGQNQGILACFLLSTPTISVGWYLQFSSVAQSCMTLGDPLDCNMPGRPVHHSGSSNSCPLSWWCHPTISSSVVPSSSRLQSFPESGSFQMSQLFASDGQSTGASASTSVLPMNIQNWFPLGWTGWISLQSKGLSRVFSNTMVQKHQFFSTQLSL